jgi:hypothetical protein
MNWDAIGSIGEIVGAIAVIATLIYLSIQIRQGINSVQGATELDAAKQWADLCRSIGHSPEQRNIWDKASAEEELTDDEHSAYIWTIAEMFFMLEGFFRQHQRGLISEVSWSPMITTIVGTLQNRYVSNWWDSEIAPLSGEFRNYVNTLRNENVEFELVDTRALKSSAKV